MMGEGMHGTRQAQSTNETEARALRESNKEVCGVNVWGWRVSKRSNDVFTVDRSAPRRWAMPLSEARDCLGATRWP